MESVGSTKLVRRGVLKLHLQLLQAGAAPLPLKSLQLHLQNSSTLLTLTTTSSKFLASFASPL